MSGESSQWAKVIGKGRLPTNNQIIGFSPPNLTGQSFRYNEVDFARCIVDGSGSTFRRIAAGVKPTAEST
jgi:hypothetical protein